jgi:hypothetical protein
MSAMTDTPADPGLSIFAQISASLGQLATYTAERQRFEQKCAQAIRSVPIPPVQAAVAGGNVLIASASNMLGPNTGYAWAVQRLTVAGLGATDTVSAYRGPASAVTAASNNLLNILTGAAPTWHPGRTGLILSPGDTLVVAGTGLAATQVTLTGEAIIMELWLLSHFLL